MDCRLKLFCLGTELHSTWGRRYEGCRICHYLSRTDSIKLSLLFSKCPKNLFSDYFWYHKTSFSGIVPPSHCLYATFDAWCNPQQYSCHIILCLCSLRNRSDVKRIYNVICILKVERWAECFFFYDHNFTLKYHIHNSRALCFDMQKNLSVNIRRKKWA